MHAFPKSARLRRSEEFRETLNQGVKTVSSQIVLFARPRGPAALGTTEPCARLGLIVSKKVGESVTRNRVKRHLREAFRHLGPELERSPELKELDLVVIARANAAAASSADISAALKHCLCRLGRQLRRDAAPNGPHA